MTTFDQPVVPVQGTIPRRAHPDDAGADLTAAETIWLPARQWRIIRTGTALTIPPGHFGLVAGRSGLGTKHGVTVINGIGVIDAGYRGEIMVGLMNHGDRPFSVNTGDRIAQVVVIPCLFPTFEAGELGSSGRGDAGFGSTGLAGGDGVSDVDL